LNLNSARSTLALHFFLSLSSFSFSCKPTKGRKGICWGSLSGVQGSSKTLFCLSYLLGIEGRRGARGHARTSPSVASTTTAAINPQWLCAAPAETLAQPRDAETDPAHPTPPRTSPRHHRGCQPGQHTTVHLLHCHFATSPVLTPVTNYPSQTSPSLIVRITPTTPIRRDRAAQSAQRVRRVPVHQHLVQHLSSCTTE
jgi:hypothetical protein